MNTKHTAFVLAATLVAAGFFGCATSDTSGAIAQPLRVSDNQRFLVTQDGQPFFWLGDTGWLLHKLDRDDTERYLEDRRSKGFNVIQTSALHGLSVRDAYGHLAVRDRNPALPVVTEGSNHADSAQYDYWDHLDYAVDLAAAKGLYMAIVPVWGTNVKSGYVSREQAAAYAKFLGERYANRSNVIWVNGGDIVGTDSSEIWHIIGSTLRQCAPQSLITFHPFGRSRSSQWFHDADWLDFNMVQSGHRTYEQDPNGIGQDTWRHIGIDYTLSPTKPTLDGEPSYENIPYGLHDWKLEKNVHLRPTPYDSSAPQPLWLAHDVRRYAYWSVFAGGCGFTYGHTSIMQMLQPDEPLPGAYNATMPWTEALNAEGATQMQHLKNLMLSRPYLDRVPDTTLVANQGQRYDHIQATRGEGYAFFYTHNGRTIEVNCAAIGKADALKKSAWFDPRSGTQTPATPVLREGVLAFTPPVQEVKDGNDWVLVLDF
jgi:hypothetical protein